MSPPADPPVLDLEGEVCPYTFLRTKLALEELPPGAELTLLLDHPPAFRSVPRSLEEDGHQVLSVAISSDGRRCTVQARKSPAA